MKKLSDYRIREFNGKFTVETKIETEEGFFRKRIKTNTVAKTEHQMKDELTTDDVRKLIEEQIKAAFEQMPLLSEKEMAEMKDQTDRNIEEMKQKSVDEMKDENEKLKNDYDFLYKKHLALFDDCIDLNKKICDLNDENSKLKEDYVSLHKKHTDMLDAYKYLNRKVEELRAMLRAKSVDDLKDARDTIFINETLKINPLFYKLVEKYEEMKQKRGAEKKTNK